MKNNLPRLQNSLSMVISLVLWIALNPSFAVAQTKIAASIKVPDFLGTLEEVFEGQGNKTVILIKDAHAVPSVQRKIQETIDYFQKVYAFRLIAFEGNSSVLDPQLFRSFPEKKALREIFEGYFDTGELTGTAAAAIFNKEAGIYHGVEDPVLYEESRKLYLKASAREKEVLQEISLWRGNGRTHELLIKLARLQLTRGEWDTFPWREINPRLQKALGFHRAFYTLALKRDALLFKNLIFLIRQHQTDSALLVAGGFHMKGLTRKLKEHGVSYLVFTPRADSAPRENFYRKIIRGDVTWKNYLRTEDGKMDFHKAFVRSSRDKLLKQSKQEPASLLKRWRTQILQDLTGQRQTSKAGLYTPFIDEVLSSTASLRNDVIDACFPSD